MTECSSAVKLAQSRRTWSNVVLSGGFGLTGAGTVMLGVLLPTLSQKWGMRDDSAGFLLFLQFFGSALGAVLTGNNRVRSLITGFALLAVCTGLLPFTGLRASFTTFFVYGLGLGLAMTATSLIVSDRSGEDRAARLEGLNFTWSAGAAAGPMLFLPFLHRAILSVLFFSLMVSFLFFLAWAVFGERQDPGLVQENDSRCAIAAPANTFLPLIMMAICSVGIEAALSGWLTTYSHRAGQRTLAGAALATSLFWLGGLISRLAFSTPLLAKVGRHTVLRWATLGIFATLAALIVAPYPAVILVFSGLAGLCVGPLYPLLLSLLLERSARGWIFAACGMGAAIFPWLTGLLSMHLGSLRYGLIAPCGAGLLMIVLRKIVLQVRNSSGLPQPSRL